MMIDQFEAEKHFYVVSADNLVLMIIQSDTFLVHIIDHTIWYFYFFNTFVTVDFD